MEIVVYGKELWSENKGRKNTMSSAEVPKAVLAINQARDIVTSLEINENGYRLIVSSWDGLSFEGPYLDTRTYGPRWPDKGRSYFLYLRNGRRHWFVGHYSGEEGHIGLHYILLEEKG